MSQMIAPAPTADADAPLDDHGEITDKPVPAPKVSRASDSADAANAPPITALQEIADADASFETARPRTAEWLT
jgi:hypothetical protein